MRENRNVVVGRKTAAMLDGDGRVPQDKVIYIAGPMTGYPYCNFPTFDLARDALRALGWTVISPADMDRVEGFDPVLRPNQETLEYESCLLRDEVAIRKCSAIAMLPGWQPSTGANRERTLSESLGHETYRVWWECLRFRMEREAGV